MTITLRHATTTATAIIAVLTPMLCAPAAHAEELALPSTLEECVAQFDSFRSFLQASATPQDRWDWLEAEWNENHLNVFTVNCNCDTSVVESSPAIPSHEAVYEDRLIAGVPAVYETRPVPARPAIYRDVLIPAVPARYGQRLQPATSDIYSDVHVPASPAVYRSVTHAARSESNPLVGVFQVDQLRPRTAAQAKLAAALDNDSRLTYREDQGLWGSSTWEFVTIRAKDVRASGSLAKAIDAKTRRVGSLTGTSRTVKPGQRIVQAWKLTGDAIPTRPWGAKHDATQRLWSTIKVPTYRPARKAGTHRELSRAAVPAHTEHRLITPARPAATITYLISPAIPEHTDQILVSPAVPASTESVLVSPAIPEHTERVLVSPATDAVPATYTQAIVCNPDRILMIRQ